MIHGDELAEACYCIGVGAPACGITPPAPRSRVQASAHAPSRGEGTRTRARRSAPYRSPRRQAHLTCRRRTDRTKIPAPNHGADAEHHESPAPTRAERPRHVGGRLQLRRIGFRLANVVDMRVIPALLEAVRTVSFDTTTSSPGRPKARPTSDTPPRRAMDGPIAAGQTVDAIAARESASTTYSARSGPTANPYGRPNVRANARPLRRG